MSTSSLFAGDLAGPVAVSERSDAPVQALGSRGFGARILAAIVKAREIQAQREVNRYLARQPDRLLHDIGLDEAAIAELRRCI